MNPLTAKRRVTLQDIAHRLGICHTTVSRALRGDPRITESLRLRVQATARELGYRPDPMLSALAQYRRQSRKTPIGAELAWINHWSDPRKLRSYREFDLYWRGAAGEAERCGFRLEEFVMGEKMSPARLENILRARNIRGILIPPHGDTSPDWGSFNWDDFCVVRFGHSIQTPRAHLVTSDQLTDGMIAFDNVRRNGYDRIGLVISRESHTRFGAGFLFSQMQVAPPLRLPPLVLDAARKEAPKQLGAWLKKGRPEAILTDIRELRELLARLGFRVPGDLGLATLSILDGNADAGIDQNSEEIGRVAVQLVISLINHNECGIPEICREVLVEGSWVNGSTLPRRAPQPLTVCATPT